jgi:hypothetical protein
VIWLRFETCEAQCCPAFCLSILSSLTAINGLNLRYTRPNHDPILSAVLDSAVVFEVTFILHVTASVV